MKILIQTLTLLWLCGSSAAFALVEPRSIYKDSRIKFLSYSKDEVFKFTGHYGYQTNIKLGDDEEVLTLSLGESTAWQIIPANNRLFIKPIEPEATTNMTLITNKRSYLFELHAEEAEDIDDPNITFDLRFLYPDSPDADNIKIYPTSNTPDLTHPERYNFNYSISGPENIAPIKIFDDGSFTYIQFRKINADLPAVFAVDEDLKEMIVNHSMGADNTLIVERVYKKLAIRVGKRVVCVFNEAFQEAERHTK